MSFLSANIDTTPAKSEQTSVCANIVVNSDAGLHAARKSYTLGLSTFCSKMSAISQSTVRVATLQIFTLASHVNGSRRHSGVSIACYLETRKGAQVKRVACGR